MRRALVSVLTIPIACGIALLLVGGRGSEATAPQDPPAPPADPAVRMVAPDFEPYAEPVPGTDARIDLLPILGGTFRMGSPAGEPGRNDDEGPQVEVTVAPFWMARTELTWEQFDGFHFDESLTMSRTPEVTADGMSRPTPPYTDMTFGMGREGFPAICMTHEAARHFCIWLGRKTGRFYRLPSEAEWEWACRAGTGSAYSFGSDPGKLDAYGWHAGNSERAYHRVGSKQPNPWGLHDMHGNVAEWCLDEYLADAYAPARGAAPRQDPWFAPTSAYPHVVRGGSWQDPPALLRSAARRGSEPGWKQRDPQIPKSRWYLTDAPFVGFRIVRPLRAPSAEERRRHEGT